MGRQESPHLDVDRELLIGREDLRSVLVLEELGERGAIDLDRFLPGLLQDDVDHDRDRRERDVRGRSEGLDVNLLVELEHRRAPLQPRDAETAVLHRRIHARGEHKAFRAVVEHLDEQRAVVGALVGTRTCARGASRARAEGRRDRARARAPFKRAKSVLDKKMRLVKASLLLGQFSTLSMAMRERAMGTRP